jgi:hypothetical protein
MNKVITDLSDVKDDEISTEVAAIITGCTGNINFTVVAQLAAVVTNKAAYDVALAACTHGNEAATETKDLKRVLLVKSVSVLGVQINVQAAGDRVKALSSGFKLEKEPTHQVMGPVQNFHVKAGAASGTMEASAEKPKTFSTHGTVFAYWDVALGPTPADKNKWFHRQSNGVSLLLTGFTPGVTYPFASAYKGLDTDALVWSDTISKMARD